MPTKTNASTEQHPDPLPNRSVPWSDTETLLDIDGVTVTLVSIDGKLDCNGGTLSSQQGGYIIEGDNELRNLNTRVIETPRTYSAIPNGIYAVTKETTSGDLGNRNSLGYGITGGRLEAALRLATGGGNYAADDYSVRIIDGMRFSIESPDGVFLFSTEIIDAPDEYEYSSSSEVDGMEIIGEESDLVLSRLPGFLDYVESVTGEQIAEFIERTENRLAFRTECGTRVEFSGNTVTSCEEAERDVSALVGERTHERYVGTDDSGEIQWETVTYSLSSDVFKYVSGEPIRGDRYCYGYMVAGRNEPAQSGGERSVVKVSRRDVILSEKCPDVIRFETPSGMNDMEIVHEKTIYPPTECE